MNTELFETLAAEYPDRNIEAEKQRLNNRLSAVLDLDPRVQVILIINSTPSFNDGDPCLPYSEISTNFYSEDYDAEIIESIFEKQMSKEELTYVQQLFANTYYWSDFREKTPALMEWWEEYHQIIKLISKICLRFDEVYDTNMALLIWKNGDKTHILTEGYSNE